MSRGDMGVRRIVLLSRPDVQACQRSHVPVPGTGTALLERLPNSFAVLGNHDFAITRDPFSQPSPVSDLDPTVLLADEARTIELRGRRVQIVGVDPRSYRRRLARPERLADPDADLRI